MITEQEKQCLERLYYGCCVYHGELHDHSNSGGTSDGKLPFEEWPEKLTALKMDFAAILDHRQVRHMYLPEWEDGLFIAGTEPGTHISDSKAEVNGMHYNILLPHRDELARLLEAFPEYNFTGGTEGHFEYPDFTTDRFCQLIDAVKARGGLFVHPHPKQVMQSEDPCDYWFRDETGMEVFYNDMDGEKTKANYSLWTALLSAGKRIWPCAGCDKHNLPGDTALTTIYAQEKSSAGFLEHLRKGDFTCGPVGIRMCIGDTVSGGSCAFDGKKLIVCVGDFHTSVRKAGHMYRLYILNNDGVVLSREIRCDEQGWLALETQDCEFYRAEVVDETRNLRIAVGSPIWNRR